MKSVPIRKIIAIMIAVSVALAVAILNNDLVWYWRVLGGLMNGVVAVGAFSLIAVPADLLRLRMKAKRARA